MTAWVRRLVVANVAMFLVTMAFPRTYNVLALVPTAVVFRPWTIVTYMFLHAGLGHIFFNMLALFFFGPRLELRLGGRGFVTLYFVSGIVAAVASIVFTPRAAVIGASGAVFGVQLGYARYWPRDLILIWGVIPIEARWLVALMTAMSLWFGFRGIGGNIAHFAHLGGFLGGYLYLKWRDWRSPARRFKQKAAPPAASAIGAADVERWRRIPRDEIHPLNREELDRLLDKIGATGIGSLTADERAFLERFSGR
jgi:membrane associated rhomboid family serine protease